MYPGNRLENQLSIAGFYYRFAIPRDTLTSAGLAGWPMCPLQVRSQQQSQETDQGRETDPKSPGNCVPRIRLQALLLHQSPPLPPAVPPSQRNGREAPGSL